MKIIFGVCVLETEGRLVHHRTHGDSPSIAVDHEPPPTGNTLKPITIFAVLFVVIIIGVALWSNRSAIVARLVAVNLQTTAPYTPSVHESYRTLTTLETDNLHAVILLQTCLSDYKDLYQNAFQTYIANGSYTKDATFGSDPWADAQCSGPGPFDTLLADVKPGTLYYPSNADIQMVWTLQQVDGRRIEGLYKKGASTPQQDSYWAPFKADSGAMTDGMKVVEADEKQALVNLKAAGLS